MPPVTPPRFSLERMQFVGQVEGDEAALTVEFEVRLLVTGLTSVPLRLAESVLTERATYEGQGTYTLESAGPEGGFVAWIRGEAGQVHRVRLKVRVPVTEVGAESRLDLSLPRSASSLVDILVPQPNVDAVISAPGRMLAAQPVEIPGRSRFRGRIPGNTHSGGRLFRRHSAHLVRRTSRNDHKASIAGGRGLCPGQGQRPRFGQHGSTLSPAQFGAPYGRGTDPYAPRSSTAPGRGLPLPSRIPRTPSHRRG